MADLMVAAIIQARMNSTRLPGKILAPLAGKPVLGHVIERLRRSQTVDLIVIATSDHPCDDALVDFARAQSVELVRGSEQNVLQRFAKAAEQFAPDIIVRVTGDAPMVDPAMLDLMVHKLQQEGAEYCTIAKGVPSIHEGFCLCTRAAFDRLLAEAAEDPIAIEHVTAYFVAHPEKFHIAYAQVPVAQQFEGARMSVDTPRDLLFFEELYRRLGVPAAQADMGAVVRLLKSAPELLEINGHVYQKKATDRTVKALIRCDGDSQVGLGHVVRCLALADELREIHGCGVSFAILSGEAGKHMIKGAGFPLVTGTDVADEASWLDEIIARQQPDILILDMRTALSPEKVMEWRLRGILIATIDDPSPRRNAADLAFYPPVPQVAEWDWTGFTGELYCGWEWVLLRRQFAQNSAPSRTENPCVLVTMGGSDPQNFTLQALRAIDRVDEPFDTVVLLGSGFSHHDQVAVFLEQARKTYRVEKHVQDVAALMRQADLAVASFGVTAYELAAMGVPAIYLCLSEDHARSASRFVEENFAVNLGIPDAKIERELSKLVSELMASSPRRHAMGESSCAAIDGLGAMRIAAKIIERSLDLHG